MPIQQSTLRSILLSAISILKCRAVSKTKDSLKDSLIRHLGNELKDLRKKVKMLEEEKKISTVAKAANKLLGRRRRSSMMAENGSTGLLHTQAAAAATAAHAADRRRSSMGGGGGRSFSRRRASIANGEAPEPIPLSFKKAGGLNTSPINVRNMEPVSPLKKAAVAAAEGSAKADGLPRVGSSTRSKLEGPPLDTAGQALEYLKSLP